MSKEFDQASDLEILTREISEKHIREQAAAIPTGEPGDCEGCGDFFTRLVRGHCGRCRDRLRLP
jgi:hypothetical protein